jgi:GNAT superfamily N-acetyltransferase
VLRITEESVTANIDQAAPLLRAHWEEIARNKDVMVLKPNVAAYAALEAAGLLICLVARDGDDMVGYCVSILNRSHLHYADLCTAMNDVLYVRPEYRGAARVGLKLIAEMERLAAERGAQLVLWHAKEHTALAGLLPRLGYEVQDVMFSRRV